MQDNTMQDTSLRCTFSMFCVWGSVDYHDVKKRSVPIVDNFTAECNMKIHNEVMHDVRQVFFLSKQNSWLVKYCYNNYIIVSKSLECHSSLSLDSHAGDASMSRP